MQAGSEKVNIYGKSGCGRVSACQSDRSGVISPTCGGIIMLISLMKPCHYRFEPYLSCL